MTPIKRHFIYAAKALFYSAIAQMFCVMTANATYVVAIDFGDSIVIGADSRQTIGEEGKETEYRDDVCKIFTFNHNIAFSSIGTSSVEDRKHGQVEQIEIAKTAIKSHGLDIEGAANQFGETLVNKLSVFINNNDFISWLSGQKNIAATGVFSTVSSGKSYIYISTVNYDAAKNLLYHTVNRNSYSLTAFGLLDETREIVNTDAFKYMIQNKTANHSNYGDAVDLLVQSIIGKEVDKSVGGNDSVLIIDGSGMRWHKKVAGCQDIKKD